MAAAALVCMMFAASAAVQLSRGQGREVSSGESDSQQAGLVLFCNERFFLICN